eukprot:CAMPEP_0203901044 /NCGR_PEP_ID=MMETSP0359-20131031/43243_1 /ASSEMBLY_ACC=CAM_ASM_000338 /TAXON_ID=268821 /ORGANISM="Scrippsiella Hangoei, Strain SHTV-5" /LENGTH=1019 /DNA_ID=CAMNT_0050824635 /DNA_START=26 /DNA_END=3086 /DNA_ORIENTATION=+
MMAAAQAKSFCIVHPGSEFIGGGSGGSFRFTGTSVELGPATARDLAGNQGPLLVPGANGANTSSAEEPVFCAFDRVFEPGSSQEAIFEEVARNHVVDAVRLLSSAAFVAMGASGGGKTFAVTGGVQRFADRGLIPRSISALFAELGPRHDRDEFQVYVSFFEIYKDNVVDLLSGAGHQVSMQQPGIGQGLSIGASLRQLAGSESDAYHQLFQGDANRHFEKLVRNEETSRGHVVYELRLVRSTTGHEATLSFMDLAAGVSGRDTAGSSIPRSLQMLSAVLESLRDRRQRPPFDASVLTQVLQPWLQPAPGQAVPHVSLISPLRYCRQIHDELRCWLDFSTLALGVLQGGRRAEQPEVAQLQHKHPSGKHLWNADHAPEACEQKLLSMADTVSWMSPAALKVLDLGMPQGSWKSGGQPMGFFSKALHESSAACLDGFARSEPAEEPAVEVFSERTDSPNRRRNTGSMDARKPEPGGEGTLTRWSPSFGAQGKHLEDPATSMLARIFASPPGADAPPVAEAPRASVVPSLELSRLGGGGSSGSGGGGPGQSGMGKCGEGPGGSGGGGGGGGGRAASPQPLRSVAPMRSNSAAVLWPAPAAGVLFREEVAPGRRGADGGELGGAAAEPGAHPKPLGAAEPQRRPRRGYTLGASAGARTEVAVARNGGPLDRAVIAVVLGGCRGRASPFTLAASLLCLDAHTAGAAHAADADGKHRRKSHEAAPFLVRNAASCSEAFGRGPGPGAGLQPAGGRPAALAAAADADRLLDRSGAHGAGRHLVAHGALATVPCCAFRISDTSCTGLPPIGSSWARRRHTHSLASSAAASAVPSPAGAAASAAARDVSDSTASSASQDGDQLFQPQLQQPQQQPWAFAPQQLQQHQQHQQQLQAQSPHPGWVPGPGPGAQHPGGANIGSFVARPGGRRAATPTPPPSAGATLPPRSRAGARTPQPPPMWAELAAGALGPASHKRCQHSRMWEAVVAAAPTSMAAASTAAPWCPRVRAPGLLHQYQFSSHGKAGALRL